MNAAKVVWPDSLSEAVFLYRSFVFSVLQESGVDYSGFPYNPIDIVAGNVEGASCEEKRIEAVSWWWKYIDDNGYIRDLDSEMSIRARLAIAVLTAVPNSVEDIYELKERFSWALQFSKKLGVADDVLTRLVTKYFQYGN
ncbi:hypothetical protein ACQ7NP_24815 [Pseudomonas anuradhapurensis]